MKARTATSRDVKEARNALMKHLADLPLSGVGQARTQAGLRKAAIDKAAPAKIAAKA
jgi:hypothetical protein